MPTFSLHLVDLFVFVRLSGSCDVDSLVYSYNVDWAKSKIRLGDVPDQRIMLITGPNSGSESSEQ